MNKIRVNIIYLAAGYARRFGADKLMADFHGKPLFEHGLAQVLRLKEQLENQNTVRMQIEVFVLAVTASAPIEDFCQTQKIAYVSNKGQENTGIASSIQKAIHTIEQMNANRNTYENGMELSEYDLFVQADQPYLDAELMKSFLLSFILSKKEIGTLSCENQLRSPNIFSADCRSMLLALEGDVGGKRVIRQNPELTFTYPVTDCKFFTDIDTMEDYHNENV